MYGAEALKALLGKKITKVEMSEDYLVFTTVVGTLEEEIIYEVEGDCCSHSYFYDFFGMSHLTGNNGPVTEVKEVGLGSSDARENALDDANALAGDSVVAYGFQIFTLDPMYGERTSVFSFRNDSNGYYGGSLEGPLGELSNERRKGLVDISNKAWYVIPA